MTKEIEELNTKLIKIFHLNHIPYVYWDGDAIKANLSDIVKALEILGYSKPSLSEDRVEAVKRICWSMINASHANQLDDKTFDEYARSLLSLIHPQPLKHKVICFSGSTRFTNEMLMLTWEYAKQGIVALGWCVLPTNHNTDGSEVGHHLAEKEGIADLLDAEHLTKIDLSEEVHVVNVNGYIGEGTKREIAYAEKTGKPVKYLFAQAQLSADQKARGEG